MARNWVVDFAADLRNQLDTMERSLVMFEAGDLKIYHNREDVSESHMEFLRKAMADQRRLLARLEEEQGA